MYWLGCLLLVKIKLEGILATASKSSGCELRIGVGIKCLG